MERRDILHLGAVTGTAALVGLPEGAEAAVPTPSYERVSHQQVLEYVHQLDRRLERVDKMPILERWAPPGAHTRTAAQEEDLRRREELIRKAVRAMTLHGAFLDLPEHGRAHPAMQEHMWRSLPEIDEALREVTGWLSDLTPADRLDLEDALREQPDFPMRIVASMDAAAGELGLPAKRRTHLRVMGEHLTRQLRRRSLSVLYDEYLEPMQRAEAPAGSIAELERRLAARMGAEAFASYKARMEHMALSWQTAPPLAAAAAGAPAAAVPQADDREVPKMHKPARFQLPPPVRSPQPPQAYQGPQTARSRRSSVLMAVGGGVLGLGAILTVAGALLVPVGVGVFLLTPGVMALLAGLIVLIVGAAIG